jgi:LL-diaminopimelate aminotransferase
LRWGSETPDLPTPEFVIRRLEQAARNPENHQYPSYWGMLEFRRAAARFMDRRFGVKVSADTEVLALIGSKEGIAHIPLAFVNPGQAALVPDPGYPVYNSATLFADGIPIPFRLRRRWLSAGFCRARKAGQDGPARQAPVPQLPQQSDGRCRLA